MIMASRDSGSLGVAGADQTPRGAAVSFCHRSNCWVPYERKIIFLKKRKNLSQPSHRGRYATNTKSLVMGPRCSGLFTNKTDLKIKSKNTIQKENGRE